MDDMTENKRPTRKAEIDKLYESVLGYRSTESFKDLLRFVARFKRMAPYNAMLVHMIESLVLEPFRPIRRELQIKTEAQRIEF